MKLDRAIRAVERKAGASHFDELGHALITSVVDPLRFNRLFAPPLVVVGRSVVREVERYLDEYPR